MQGCAAGRCRVARRAEVAIRAGTAISLRRIVGVEEPDCFRTVNLLGFRPFDFVESSSARLRLG